jgi:hypothetical protein
LALAPDACRNIKRITRGAAARLFTVISPAERRRRLCPLDRRAGPAGPQWLRGIACSRQVAMAIQNADAPAVYRLTIKIAQVGAENSADKAGGN